MKIDKKHSKETSDIYIGTAYISPSQNSDADESLETFFREALSFREKGTVVIQGDFNAHTGMLPDFIARDKSDDGLKLENYDPPLIRNSEDNKTCKRGNELLDLCKSFDFLIANGRKIGDIFGRVTSIQWNGTSVVDYVLTPASTLDKIQYLKVGKFIPWLSDHCPISFRISSNNPLNLNVDMWDRRGIG